MQTTIRILTRALLFTLALQTCVHAQQKKPPLKDSLDGAFDMSDYIIDANGFVPIPLIITEKALGGFGGAVIPVFIKKRPPYIDSTKKGVLRTPVAPDITGGLALYTLNNTWMVAGFRSGTLVKSRIKYMIGAAYANVNLSFYKTLSTLGEKEFKFNIRTAPLFMQATKRISLSHWYAGFKYLLMKAETRYQGDGLLDSIANSMEFSAVISQLGMIIELDNRDNIFTPDKGIKLHIDGNRSDDFIGSDYDFWKMNYYTYIYTPLSKKVTGGFRADGQEAFGDIPFYMKPYMNMRGLPAVRYQGNATVLTELELRWDFVRRWSLMAYGGTGKAFDDWSDFGSSNWVSSYGTGFRYMLARKFKLRVGIDVAKGPESWTYYIVFGSNWLK
ncbi:MAG TPA: hypothetical protein VHL77_07480 [Ferruginibacter sp.]|jgi:hypothetical protein|nr:hypothetical protein [Ferruginibacter sp.]